MLVYLRRSIRPGVAKIAALYLSVAALWSAGLALQQSGRLSFVNYSLLSDLAAIGLVLLSVFFLLLTRLILVYRNGAWRWIILGLAWCSLPPQSVWLAGCFRLFHPDWAGWQSWLQTGLQSWLILGWGTPSRLDLLFT